MKARRFLLALKGMGVQYLLLEGKGGSSLEELFEKVKGCRRCKLWQGRTHVVFGEGDLKARIMFVGEAPGEEEDRLGRPFVGRAGRLLDELMERAGLKRQEVYIANVLKCRPPSNRDPEEDEIEACKEYLFAQIAIIKPKVIVTLGRYALRVLSGGEEKITMVRGSLREHMGSKLVPTYHPSFLLRNERKMVEAIEDIRKARELLLTR